MMRPVLPGDVAAVARALLAVPKAERAALCRRIFGQASEALAHVRLTGRLHPRWGDGSLAVAARACRLADEPFLDDLAYLGCTRVVLKELAAQIDAEAQAAPARCCRQETCPPSRWV